MNRARLPRPVDTAWITVTAVWLIWVLLASALNGRPVRLDSVYVVAPLVLVAGVLLGRVAAKSDADPPAPAPRPLWLDASLLFLLVALLPGVGLRLAPGPPPLGYPNANSAAAIQVMVLIALVLLGAHHDRWSRTLYTVALAASAFAVVHHGSQAGILVAIPVALAVVVMLVRPSRRSWWAVALGVSTLVGAVYGFLTLATASAWPDLAVRALSRVRQDLWTTALALWSRSPVIGSGPGSFAEANPYAVDADLVSAHSVALQVAAELGLVGVVILILLIVLGYLVGVRISAPHGVLASAAWTALWVHSLMDHLLDHPGMALVAGLVLGWAGSSAHKIRDSEQLDVAQRETPG